MSFLYAGLHGVGGFLLPTERGLLYLVSPVSLGRRPLNSRCHAGELEMREAGMAFALLAPKVTTVSGEGGCDGDCTLMATGTVAGSLACPAEPGKSFWNGVQS